MLAVVLATAGALTFAFAAVLQHRANSQVGHEHSLRPSLLWHLGHQRLFLASLVLDGLGYGLHAWALSVGAIVTVQLVVQTGMLLFGMALHATLSRRAPRQGEWVAIVVLLAGLALFLTAASPDSGRASTSVTAWVAVTVSFTAVAVGLTVAAGRRPGPRKAVLLGLATGVVFALTAAFTKAWVELFTDDGLWPAVLSVITVGVIGAGVIGMIVENSAYQAGPLAAGLPALIVADPLATAVLGVVLYGERLDRGAPAVVLVVVALVLIIPAVIRLARSDLVGDDRGPGFPRSVSDPSAATSAPAP